MITKRNLTSIHYFVLIMFYRDFVLDIYVLNVLCVKGIDGEAEQKTPKWIEIKSDDERK